MNHEEKLIHVKKLINTVRVFYAGMLLSFAAFIVIALGILPLEAIPSWFYIAYAIIMFIASWRIQVLNCCPWCGAAFLWQESLFNQVARNPLDGIGVKNCANCGMPE